MTLPRPLRAPALLASLVLVAVSGCGVGSQGGGVVAGQTLTIYSSLPLRGEQGALARDLVDAEKLALRDGSGRVGDYSVQYVSLNDAPGSAPRAVPGVVAANARKAVRDPSAIAFLGSMTAAASAISIPVVNEAGYLQVDPTVSAALVAAPRLYPAGRRTAIALAPGSAARARALAQAARGLGGRAVVVRGAPGRAAAAARRAVGADPRTLVVAGEELAVPAFLDALGPAAARTRIALAVPADPAPGPFARRFHAVFGRAPDPRAAYGYWAMRLVVSSLRRAAPHTARRRVVIDRALARAGGPAAGSLARLVDLVPPRRLASGRP
jgi:ABC-type branched-subunit amino acid transport system substrate-binding protein